MSAPAVSAPLDDLAAALAPRLTGDLRTDTVSRALYATDGSMYQKMPVAVLRPKTLDDVYAAVEEAIAREIPILPRGGGSALAGQTVNHALVVDFSPYLNGILEVNGEEKWARVQPGCVLDLFNAEVGKHGLTFGPDPASSSRATLGGMVGNNATGTHSLVYGNTIHHVRRLDTILSDGSRASFEALDAAAWNRAMQKTGFEGDIYRGLDALIDARGDTIRRDTSKHWRRNSGYRLEHLLESPRNVARLLCGSEGTLAITTEIEVGLVEKPKKTALGVVHYATLDAALRSAVTILTTDPSAVELFDEVALDAARRSPGFSDKLTFVSGRPGAILITEYFGDTDAELAARLDALEAALAAAGEGTGVVRALAPQQISNVWAVRKEGLGLIMSAKGDLKPIAFIEDASVPVEHLADYIAGLLQVLHDTNTPVAVYAHASAGTLHVRPFINTKDAREVEKMRDIALASMELVRRYGGTVSSEHGDGLARSWLNRGLLGDELYAANVEAKTLFDPHNRLNPGNVVEAPPMTEDLRLGPSYETLDVLTELDWSREGSFAGAVEMCNGNGACRKLQSGVMCPSYMVTLDEEHSTRGRANALRMAMSGEAGRDAFTSERVYEVLDLCVSCKGCKTECPSNVDMAKMKMEWLGHYYDEHGVSARTRFFANAPKLARALKGRRARLVNWANGKPFLRKQMEKVMGITARRPLPPFAAEPFTTWFKKQTWRTDGPEVILFADTFTNYNHPEIGRAAARFLDRVGYRVTVTPQAACCGRPYLSKGLVKEARDLAKKTVDLLAPLAARDVPIIGLEPSCVLTFGDEFRSMLPNDSRVEKLAAQAMLFEDFVASIAQAGALDGVRWKKRGERVLLHGHCHQKALVGTKGALAALALPGYEVSLIDSSCCGMAGSFGYEAEHVDISIKMAERRLAPAVRAASEDTLIAAGGTSCRAQIEDTTASPAAPPRTDPARRARRGVAASGSLLFPLRSDVFSFLDLAGTFVFAVAGGFRATRHALDVLGVLVLAVATGVGGGLIRDVLLGATPAAALQDERYLFICLLGGGVAFVAAPHVARHWNVVMVADAIGLGVFAAIGAAKGAAYGLGPIGVMMMAALTATGGGVVRDVLVGIVPAVIRHDFYATAALIGGGLYLGATFVGLSEVLALWIAALSTTGLRFYAMHGNMRLPVARLPDEGPTP